MTEFTIRPPEEKDIEALAQLHFYMWHEFYKDIVPKAYADKHFSMEQCLQLQQEIIKATKTKCDQHVLWVAENSDHNVAGICYVSPNESAVKFPEISRFEMELQRLYIWPEYRNQGLGTELFDLSLDWLRKRHYKSVCIWAFDENNYTGFYKKHGVTAAEKFTHDFEGKNVDLTLLGLAL